MPRVPSVEGVRALYIASIAPVASISASVSAGPIGSTRMFGGRSILSFSLRPGSSSPPMRYLTESTGTPYSSCRMPRIHTGAVS